MVYSFLFVNLFFFVLQIVYLCWNREDFCLLICFLCFIGCVLEVHEVDIQWKQLLKLRIMMMGSLETVGLIEAVMLCLHRSGFPIQLCTNLFGYLSSYSLIQCFKFFNIVLCAPCVGKICNYFV